MFNWHRLSDVIPLVGHPEFFYYLLVAFRNTEYLRVQILFAAFFGYTVRMQSCWPKDKKESKVMEVLNGKITWLGSRTRISMVLGLNQPFCEESKTKSKDDSKTKKDGKVEKHVRISEFTKLAGLRTMMNHNMMVMMVVVMMMNHNMMVMMVVVVMVIMMNHYMMAIISNVFRYCYGLLLLSSFCHMSNYINTSFVFSLVSLPITVVVIPYCIAFQ